MRDAAAGCLTIAFSRVGAQWELVPPDDDPFVAQELAETAYHVLWELVHVFLDHRDRTTGRDSGASSFLYPFLGAQDRTSTRSSPTCARRCSPRPQR